MKDLQELGAELHRLADDDPLGPVDAEALLQRGKRGRRRRRVAAIGGVTAGVAVIATAATYLPHLSTTSGQPAGTSPSPTTSFSESRIIKGQNSRPVDAAGVSDSTLLSACTAKLAQGGPARWHSAAGVDLTGWRVITKMTAPRIGTAFVAASPDGRKVATCDVYGRSIPAGQGQSSFTQVHPPRSAPATVDPNMMGQGSTCATAVPLPCKGWLLLEAGLAPKEAVKLRIDAKNGHTLVVPIKDGWWLALWPTGANGQMPADYRFYDAKGKALPQGPAAMEKIRIP
ncbi:hypothetical protein [Kribbella sp. NPDC006257]|uniref:hypothetical protein n=1 Tax=Kribbella sp. NPDC006257 TaxID=3156738 RepID=UPI0033BD6BE5